MHDIKFIRENPQEFDRQLARRGIAAQSAELLKLDAVRRKEITEQQELQQRRNSIAKEIGMVKSKGGDASALLEESAHVNLRLKELEAKAESGGELEVALSVIPNLLSDDVPEGSDETHNKIIKTVGVKPEFHFKPLQHFEIGDKTSLIAEMDFERAAKLSGSRFVVLSGRLARLERALSNFMLDLHTREFGFTEMYVPYLVKSEALYGTSQLPKFAEDLFRTEQGHWLIPTSEVSLTNLVAGEILNDDILPLRLTSYTPCFRSEAGSAGRDTRGMIRQHQFGKVEMVVITHPEKSDEEQLRMLTAAEEVLQRLGLAYRVVELCSGDTGFAARRTFDIEVWLPGQDAYREISSISNCGDFQARRMKARFRGAGEKETRFVHTLNGSGLAVGRTLVAVLENYQTESGDFLIPEALQKYM
jgi:seryl-tRNA synthetase